MRVLSPDQKIRYAVAGITLAVLLPVLFIPTDYIRWVAAAVTIFSAVAACVLVKKRSILSFNKRQILLLLTVIAALYVMLLYLAGIHYGFEPPIHRFSLSTCFLYVLPSAMVIIATEITRAVLIGEKKTGISVVLFFACVLSELTLGTAVDSITSIYTLMDFIGMTVFPAVTSNILYHYISKRYGKTPIIVYRLILTMYVYFLPILPAVPDVFAAFTGLLLPLAALLFIDVLFEKKKKRAMQRKSKWGVVAWGALIVLMISVVMLISCQFRYGILVIATESMTGEVNKGDAVVFEAYKDQHIQEGDVIVFQKNKNAKVVHRVVSIQQAGNETRYFTKGDANEDMDFGYITEAQIVGVVQFKVLYIGYPSLWLRELFD